ncbi:transposase family protein [Streptomyces phaeochromogenes]|uniref:transposase family protein n=1 Tax=Streptomyces phaeochromogenes TaxID=1923 RepID=UPI00324A2CD2
MVSKTVEAVLFPGTDVRVERVSDSCDVFVVEAVSTARPGRCPDCRKQARRIHGMYQRVLNERPLGSRRVVVRLRVRRYFCDRKNWSRTTFVEQVPGLSERHRHQHRTGPVRRRETRRDRSRHRQPRPRRPGRPRLRPPRQQTQPPPDR